MANIPASVWIVGLLVAAPYAFYAVQVGRRKKEVVRFKLRRMGVSVIADFGGIIIAWNTRHTPIEAIIFGVVLGLHADSFSSGRRSATEGFLRM